MKKIKAMILTMMVVSMMIVAATASARTSEDVMSELTGIWGTGNVDFIINETYFVDDWYTVEQAYIDGPFLYAWLNMKSGSKIALRAWKAKDAGPVYNVITFWNANKPERSDNPVYQRRH